MIEQLASAMIVLQEADKRREREEEEWELDRLKREATIKTYRNQNKYQFSCSTEASNGSCSFSGNNSFENKSIENE